MTNAWVIPTRYLTAKRFLVSGKPFLQSELRRIAAGAAAVGNCPAHNLLIITNSHDDRLVKASTQVIHPVGSAVTLTRAAGGSFRLMNMLMESETTLELEHRILERIAGRVRNFRAVRAKGRLVLEGSTSSFHAKQLVTHAALELAPDDELVNAITVDRQISDCIPDASRRY